MGGIAGSRDCRVIRSLKRCWMLQIPESAEVDKGGEESKGAATVIL